MSCRYAGFLIIGLGLGAACGEAAREEPFSAGAGAGTGAIATGENRTVGAGSSGAGAGGEGRAGSLTGASAGKGGAGSNGLSAGSSGAKAVAAGSGGAGAGGAGSGGAGAAGAAAAGGAGHAGNAAAAGSGGGTGMATLSGPSQCAGSELLLCEGFESDSLDSSIWSTMMSKPSVDAARAARGGKSLHVHTSATGASGIQTTKIFPRAEGRYYGRMFVYFDALPTSPQWAHWTIVGANPKSGAGSGEIRVGGQHDGKIERFGVGTDQGPTGDWTNLDEDPKGAVQAVPLKKWLCVEWLHDWMNDQTKFYLDGMEHPSLATTPDVDHGGNSSAKYEIPELGSVWVGFWNYNQGKPVMPSEFDVWIDEVAFDDERIGCER